jgi:hypothetical protein
MLLFFAGCGFERFETDLEIDFPRREVRVVSASLNAEEGHAGACTEVAACRDLYAHALEVDLAGLNEGGITGEGEIRVREGEIDLVTRYVVPMDHPMLDAPDSFLREIQVDRGGSPRTALALVLPGTEATRPVVTVKGPHVHVSVPVEVPGGAPPATTEVWTFYRGRTHARIVLGVHDPERMPWAPNIPGLVESLTNDPIRRP